MAATTVKDNQFLLGPLQGKIFTVDLDGVTTVALTEADHGFRSVSFASFNNETTEGDGLVVISAVNTVTLSGFTSGDVVKLLILGN
jgi:hypothetical protein